MKKRLNRYLYLAVLLLAMIVYFFEPDSHYRHRL